ncbi:MAG: asparagine synthase (glutamine-hydrolyzing) [Chloroflexi bacterium]|nr:asparagine synthase (glutamine-hydrolyzing) [Chloroflexota bacterium]
MCGIFGKFSINGVDREEVARMGRVLIHRGPDDVGIHVDGPIGIGNHRLSIIDLEGGRQPIFNEDGTIWIVFNGEIYNYRALREELLQRGHKFQTSSDTEAIVHLYEDEGVDCVKRLQGMFAFAIWDEPRQRLFIARDHLGQKPLYHHYRPGLFLFASEMKAILETGDVAPEPNPEAMHHYLSLRFVPPPDTMFKGIHKLLPAHSLVLENGNLTISRYWELKYEPKVKMSVKEAVAALDQVLGDAVESHLVSDVKVGALLSGGLDSGLVTALMSTRTKSQVSTFSVGVTERDWNELPYARMVAQRYNTDHFDVVVKPNPLEILPTLIWHLDEPSDPSAACKYFVAQEASKHVKVVLGGDGGDEMLGGYDRYVGNRFIKYYCALPKALRNQVVRRLMSVVPESFTYKSLASKLRWLDQMSNASEDQRYAASVNFFRFDEDTKRRVYSPEFAARVGHLESIDYIASVFNSAPVKDLVDRMLYTDVNTQLAEHGEMIVDRTTMAFSLESRSPFLDRKVAEFCATLPPNLKLRQHRLRFLERELARKYLPAEVVKRRKQGFGLPLGYWFQSTLGELTADLFRSSSLAEAGFVTSEGLLSVLNEHRHVGIDHSHRLWILLNLEMWHRIFIKREGIGTLIEMVKQPAYA